MKKPPSMSDTAAEALTALRQAVNEVVESHRHAGRPLVVWKDGKVEKVLPGSPAVVREPRDEHPYGNRNRGKE